MAAGVDATDCDASNEACTPFMVGAVLLRENEGGGCSGGPGCNVEAMQPVGLNRDQGGGG